MTSAVMTNSWRRPSGVSTERFSAWATLSKGGVPARARSNEPISAYLTRDHVVVDDDYSDTQLAETFLHHRVLIVPVRIDGRVSAVVTRSDFFASLADRLGV